VVFGNNDRRQTPSVPNTYEEFSMSIRRRILAVAGIVAAASGLLMAGTASPAAAASGATRVIVVGSMTTVDDDGLGAANPKATKGFTADFNLTPANPTKTIIFKSACADDEVRAELGVRFTRLSNGNIYVEDAPSDRLALRLFEGSSCSTNDFEDDTNLVDMVVGTGSTDTRSLGARNDPFLDRVDASFRVSAIAL
jgi:hypothetical protein